MIKWFQIFSNSFFFVRTFFRCYLRNMVWCILDCEKSLENVPTNVYESVCGSEISDFLGNQRTTPNSQSYTAANTKPFSSITNGKYLDFDFFLLSPLFRTERERETCVLSWNFMMYELLLKHWLRIARFNQSESFHFCSSLFSGFAGCVFE